jgi:hypothetical protein
MLTGYSNRRAEGKFDNRLCPKGKLTYTFKTISNHHNKYILVSFFKVFCLFCCTFQVLGLEICADTVVGNAMLRGISGGQRKRVTTGKINLISILMHIMINHLSSCVSIFFFTVI